MAINSPNYTDKPVCHPVLPTVFDDSLSYYEAICKLYNSFDEFVATVDGRFEDYTDTAQKYTDTKIAEALQEFRDFNEAMHDEVINLGQYVDKAFTDFTTEVDGKFAMFTSNVNSRVAELTNEVRGAYQYTDDQISANNDFIFAEINKGVVTALVLNYFTGEKITIQKMFDYLCELHLESAIKYEQLIAKNLTYNALVASNISYTNLLLHGNTL